MLKEVFEKNRNIIINTDIDGIIAGVILVKALGCKIVGFTNSKEYVWLADNHNDLYSHVYIDMFVTDDNVVCIDQHIVAISDEHQDKIKASRNKFSPQIDGNRKFTKYEFAYKYPFGVTHYLIAQLESEGIKIELPDLKTKVPNSEITLADLILRADDAMVTTVYAYRDNALNWWEYLKSKTPQSEIIKNLFDYLEELRQRALEKMVQAKKRNTIENREEACKSVVDPIKSATSKYFKDEFNSKSSDGGFRYIADKDGVILPNFKKYVNSVAAALGVGQIEIPEHFITHKGVYHRSSWLPYYAENLVNNYTFCGHKIFSYAFIYSPSEVGEINFSFTLDMK